MPTLLSLFDGSGGFPLAGSLCGITPIAASEVEPYPIAVTKSRFPDMKHLGDISKINGAEIEPVDIITFGSPCQDLSVAGKRAGLKHANHGDAETTRSGLFIEAVRIIKEMREQTDGEYPRFAVWENVPGAFSSNRGEDFRIVLEEIIKIAEPNAVMPEVPKKGWAYADSYSGDGWSLAYRVLDAQYWGVPQRRRRIYLVADFGGKCAREILFEREGLRGYFTKGRTPWKTATTDAQGSLGADDREGEGFDGYNGALTGIASATLGINCGASTGRNGVIQHQRRQSDSIIDAQILDDQGGSVINIRKDGQAPTLRAQMGGHPPVVLDSVYAVDQGGGKSSVVVKNNQAPTLTCAHDGSPAVAYGVDVYNQTTTGDKAKTLTGIKSDADHVPCVSYSFDPGASRDVGVLFIEECAKTLTNGTCPGHHDGVVIVNDPIAIDRAAFNQGENALYHPQINEDGTNSTLVSKGPSAVCYSIDEKCANTYVWEDQANTLAARDYKQPQAVCYEEEKPLGLGIQSSLGIDKMAEDASPCLINGNNPGWQIGVMTPKPTYIVRRLTPTECARLQGFADRWGNIDIKTELSDKEYRFWLDVRNTHAAINGKQTKEYTKVQMLTWYNKLLSDSAEYKMWGNGIALPCALYVMQGIADVLNN